MRPAQTRRDVAVGTHRSSLTTLAALLLTALAGCGAPEEPDPQALFASTAAERTGELLIASAPEGWMVVTSLNRPNLRIAEFANPANLTPDRVDSARFESQTGRPLPDPIDFVLGMREELRSQCKGFRDFAISAGYENGYPTAVRLMLCRQKGDPPRGEVRMVKTIEGAEQFYIVSRSRSSAPFEAESEPITVEEMADWSAWIGAIRLCNTRTNEHPCPAAPGPGEAPGNSDSTR